MGIRGSGAAIALSFFREAENNLNAAQDVSNTMTSFQGDSYLQQALQALMNDEPRAAVTGFQQVIAYDPSCLQAYYELGRLWVRGDQLSAAYQCVRAGLSHATPNSSPWAALQGLELQVLLHGGRLDEATRRVNQLALTCEDDIIVPLRLAIAEVKRYQGQLPDAVKWVREALASVIATQMPPAKHSAALRTDFAQRHEALLWDTLAQLASSGVHAFPTSGTLLGITRDGTLLPFDKDVDVGLPFSEMARAIQCLQQQGWKEDKFSSGLSNPRAFRHPSGLVVDLCGFMIDQQANITIGGFWMAGVRWKWLRITEYPTLNLRLQLRPAGKVWLLEDPEGWLSSLYGEAWRAPDPQFNTVVGAANLRAFSPLVEYYAVAHLIKYWQAGNLEKLHATLRHVCRHRPEDSLFNALHTKLEEGRL